MKKFIIALATTMMMFTLAGCGNSSTQLNYDRFAKIENESHLYYDVNTNVVYFIANGNISKMSPYYANNGFPYVYNVDSNEMEEINIIEEMIKW